MEVTEINLDELELKYARLSVRRGVAERKLLASLGESGQQSPVIVVRGGEAGHYIVIDGHKRVRALKRLKADVARVAVWEMSEA
ncbi:MAG: ParB N-terminal domain-containing protein, partial [Nitrospirota bacterium]|nr:ParB N-terminal domain-containing protein [Nitrospirota bacterium]